MSIDPEFLIDTSRGATSPADDFEDYGQYFEDRVAAMSAEEYLNADFAQMLEDSGFKRVTGPQAKNALSDVGMSEDNRELGNADLSKLPNAEPLVKTGHNGPGD